MGRPEWTQKSTYEDRDGVLYGVGRSPALQSKPLARATAENRARAEIAKVIGARVEVADGMASRRATVVASMTGVEIVDHWIDPRDRTVFALARLRRDAP